MQGRISYSYEIEEYSVLQYPFKDMDTDGWKLDRNQIYTIKSIELNELYQIVFTSIKKRISLFVESMLTCSPRNAFTIMLLSIKPNEESLDWKAADYEFNYVYDGDEAL
jgi:hypothetical protein